MPVSVALRVCPVCGDVVNRLECAGTTDAPHPITEGVECSYVPVAEVERLRKALEWISEYGSHDGDLLKGHAAAMRNIATTALRTDATCLPSSTEDQSG